MQNEGIRSPGSNWQRLSQGIGVKSMQQLHYLNIFQRELQALEQDAKSTHPIHNTIRSREYTKV